MLDPQHDAAIGFISNIMPLHAPTSCSWRGTAPAPAAERSARSPALICSVAARGERRRRQESSVSSGRGEASPVVRREGYRAGGPSRQVQGAEAEQEVKETSEPRHAAPSPTLCSSQAARRSRVVEGRRFFCRDRTACRGPRLAVTHRRGTKSDLGSAKCAPEKRAGAGLIPPRAALRHGTGTGGARFAPTGTVFCTLGMPCQLRPLSSESKPVT